LNKDEQVKEKKSAETEKICQDEKNCQNLEVDAREEKLSELEILKQSLEQVKEQKENLYDQLLRLQAEFTNFRKRSEEEKRKSLEWGKEKILAKQISMSDVLEQALKSAKSGANTADIIVGLDMISKEFEKMLKEEGVEEIKLEDFDPNLCEALDAQAVESDEYDGKILEVYQKGYKINGRLMRAAKVKEAKKKQ
jgi:molecular chaperone GrpE